MKKEKLISVIIPVYKVEEYLERCVNSVINQTYKNLEIILVDDGSPDNCPAICDKLAKLDTRIKVIHKKNGGVSVARNTALDLAQGDFIAFVDSDDSIEPTLYEKQLTKQTENDYDLVFARYNYEENGNITPVRETSLKTLCETNDWLLFFNHTSNNDIKNGIVEIDNNVMCNIWRVLFKKEVIDKSRFPVGIKYMEDFIFMISLLINKNYKLGYVDEYLYNYLLRRNSACHDKSNGMIENSENYMAAISPLLMGTKYEYIINALEFFCYTECVISKYVFKSKIDLKPISHWNCKNNYKINKTISYGKKQHIKFFLVRYKLNHILALLYKVKK